jgi:hypothetical protein
LILGGGNNAGRAPDGTSAFATLICEPTPPFTERISSPAGFLLSPTGDFKIDDRLSSLRPAVCISPMLLIRNAANNGWFAVGKFQQ